MKHLDGLLLMRPSLCCEHLIRKRLARMKSENKWEKKRKGPKTVSLLLKKYVEKVRLEQLNPPTRKIRNNIPGDKMPGTENKCTNTARCISSTLTTGLPDYEFYPVRTLHYDFKALLGKLQTPRFWNDGSSRFGGRR